MCFYVCLFVCLQIHKKDSKLSVLLKELAEVRKNFSDCKKEVSTIVIHTS